MKQSSIGLVLSAAGFFTALVMTSTADVSATNSILSTWQARYPTSLSDDNTAASGRVCYLCHGASNSQWNAYGWQIKLGLDSGMSASAAIAAAEALNSDGDAGGFTNLEEISANAQPGWTNGPNNTIFTSGGSTPGQLPPGGIAGTLDPVVLVEPDINLNPTALDFGAVTVGDSMMRTAVIENAGNADLTVSGITACGGTSTEYTWSPDAFPIAVPAGGSQTLSVFFAPIDGGAETGCLQIASDDPDENPAVLNVTATGVPPTVETPDINLAPTSLDFGTAFVGNTTQLAAQIQNTGTATLLVAAISRCGGTSMEFSWANSIPITVDPGGSTNLLVRYAPIDEGSDTGCFLLASNDPDENPTQLDLAGTGQQPPAEGVDLDIARFRVARQTRIDGGRPTKPLALQVVIRNGGFVDEPRPVTIVGMQNGVEVYNETVMASAPAGGSDARVDFPPYVPTVEGDIMWVATIADDDPDVDEASATTRVQARGDSARRLDEDQHARERDDDRTGGRAAAPLAASRR